jgi:hypothetical protein
MSFFMWLEEKVNMRYIENECILKFILKQVVWTFCEF